MGRLYMDQGYQNQAINVFNKGLEMVPRTNTQCQVLEQEKQLAEQRMNRPINFFVNAPYDIACCIIDQLIHKDLFTIVQCTRVSSSWRSLILDYPKPWRHIYADDGTTEASLRSCHIMPPIIHHAQHFGICPSQRNSKKCLELIQTKKTHQISILCW
ncbi:hypothetical protein BDA99DRAFT_284069 [Phascolomyces articulosus]|uniref:F-box domain-containing protein n=1 Tax=Phascolomyces articulosus TaxID=60185 RepID=A0AAD5PHF7_9FUNG|nr:hypothetical protein BDA99DRAFT_284069 [Phascolomyces articulosus]